MWITPALHVSRYIVGYVVSIQKPDGTTETKTLNSYRADTTADVPQLIPIRGVMNIPTVGTQVRMRIKKLQSEKTTLGTMELKGTIIPILLKLWENQLLLSTNKTANMTDSYAKELLNDKTLEVTITWDTDTATTPR